MNEDVLVINIEKEGLFLKLSSYHKGEKADHREYGKLALPEEDVKRHCAEIASILDEAIGSGHSDDRVLAEFKKRCLWLFDNLFTAEIRDYLKNTKSDSLTFFLDEELVSIPWELMHDGSHFLCLKFAVGRKVRIRSRVHVTERRDIGSNIKALILIDPTSQLKSAYEEGISILNELDRTRGKVKAYLKIAATDIAFINDHIGDYDIVHFAGRAVYDLNRPFKSGWALQSETFSAWRISNLISRARLPGFIFSDACKSGEPEGWKEGKDFERAIYGLASAFLALGVNHYIGTFWEMKESSRLRFVNEFYKYIVDKIPFGEALKLARTVLVEQYGLNSLLWANYILYGDPETGLFPAPHEKEAQAVSPKVKSSWNARKMRMGAYAGILAVLAAVFFFTKFFTPRQTTGRTAFQVGENFKEGLTYLLSGGQKTNGAVKEAAAEYSKFIDTDMDDKHSLFPELKAIITSELKEARNRITLSEGPARNNRNMIEESTLNELYGGIFSLQDALYAKIFTKYYIREMISSRGALAGLPSTNNTEALKYLAKARIYLARKNFSLAVRSCRRSLEFDPGYIAAEFLLAVIYEEMLKPDPALSFYERFRKSAERHRDKRLLISADANMGRALIKKGRYKDALHHEQMALDGALQMNDRRACLRIRAYIAVAYLGLNQEEKALGVLLENKKTLEELNDSSGVADIFFEMGLIYSLTEEAKREESIEHLYLEKSLDIYESIDYNNGLIKASLALAYIYMRKGDYGKAMERIKNGMKAASGSGYAVQEGLLYKGAGDIASGRKEYVKAAVNYEKTLRACRRPHDAMVMAAYIDALLRLGFIHVRDADADQVSDKLQELAGLSDKMKKSKDYDVLMKAGYGDLSEIFEKMTERKDVDRNMYKYVYSEIAKIYLSIGDNKEAKHSIDLAISGGRE